MRSFFAVCIISAILALVFSVGHHKAHSEPALTAPIHLFLIFRNNGVVVNGMTYSPDGNRKEFATKAECEQFTKDGDKDLADALISLYPIMDKFFAEHKDGAVEFVCATEDMKPGIGSSVS